MGFFDALADAFKNDETLRPDSKYRPPPATIRQARVAEIDDLVGRMDLELSLVGVEPPPPKVPTYALPKPPAPWVAGLSLALRPGGELSAIGSVRMVNSDGGDDSLARGLRWQSWQSDGVAVEVVLQTEGLTRSTGQGYDIPEGELILLGDLIRLVSDGGLGVRGGKVLIRKISGLLGAGTTLTPIGYFDARAVGVKGEVSP